jgi:taurine dioxygenase
MGTPNKSIQVEPAESALGAEISGVDLAGDLSAQTISEIRSALLEHLVIFFRGQSHITSDQQARFAKRFGDLVEYPMVKGLDGTPEVIPVVKLPEERVNFGGLWHTDTTYLDEPPLGSMLFAREIPPTGGDTEFANMYLAYESLSPALRAFLDGLTVVNSSAKAAVSETRKHRLDKPKPTELVAEHPAVRTHPETERKALYVSFAHALRFKELSVEESQPVLEFLYAHQIKPEFVYRFKWTVGAMAFWDNRSCQHNPLNDYHGYKRVMHRVTVAGDRPR